MRCGGKGKDEKGWNGWEKAPVVEKNRDLAHFCILDELCIFLVCFLVKVKVKVKIKRSVASMSARIFRPRNGIFRYSHL